MRINKKAALELGISTVVVLVIAMVIIAGGVAFIRGFFSLGTKKLGGAFDVADFGVKPTPDEPLVLVDGRAVALKSGANELVRVGFYNKGPGDATANIEFGDCISTSMTPLTTCQNPTPIIKSLTQTVKPDSAGFETYVQATCKNPSVTGQAPNLPPAKYVCTLRASQYNGANPVLPTVEFAKTQITIEVTS